MLFSNISMLNEKESFFYRSSESNFQSIINTITNKRTTDLSDTKTKILKIENAHFLQKINLNLQTSIINL